ncbi:MAG TPA: SDR family oxidoreductase [Gemmatimonadales bacterium]|nr:SDR family oxidoreductase [Gemmatimonadales bacterium]
MDLQLGGKRALVTGSTAGIGHAIASLLASEGAAVTVNGRTKVRVDDAVRSIRQVAPRATVTGVAADVGTKAGCDELARATPEVDILVNNVSIFEPRQFEDIPDERWMQFFETNVMSGVRLARHYLPYMRQANWGRILFVSSESAVQIPVEMIHYGMTKMAQIAVARGLAEATAGTGITVNSVLPGPTRSEGAGAFLDKMAKDRGVDFATIEREFFEQVRPTSLLQRFETVEEVAAMAVYLCSPLASGTTGSAVRVDGGVVRAAV